MAASAPPFLIMQPLLRSSYGIGRGFLSNSLQRTPIFLLSRVNRVYNFAPAVQSRSKVYTRTGDKGTSSLYTGERRRKDDSVFEALGDIDELNAWIGKAREHCTEVGEPKLLIQLEQIQNRLMDLGAHVATPRDESSNAKQKRTEVQAAWVKSLEYCIDEMDERLPPLVNFILPSGGEAATTFHICRTICRRAERRVVVLLSDGAVDEAALQYLNRLSDYLFTAARFSAVTMGKKETLYRKAA